MVRMIGIEDGLMRGRVLVELGRLAEADAHVATLRERSPDDLDVVGLHAKVKHLRGELSQAIASWGEVTARSLRGLASMGGELRHETPGRESPEDALEPALAMLRDRRPADARAWCVRFARQWRGRDAQRYKLGVIAGSWLAELSGDLATARAELEQLGGERGFELDLDRLLALTRVYDALATPEAIDRAARVCRHLLERLEQRGLEKLSVLGLYASLERRAGRTAVAAQLDARFLAAMRRRMHRASLGDAVRVAAREYLPIGELRAVRWQGRELPADLSRRERAVARAIDGHDRAARSLFAAGNEALDGRYARELDRGVAAAPVECPAIGRVLAAAVYHFGPRPKGLVHEIWVRRTYAGRGRGGKLPADEIHGNLTAELRSAVRNAFEAVREYARSKFPHATADLDDYTYTYKLPKEDEPSSGLSAGLPTALAFLSTFLQRPVPLGLASTGALVCEAHDVIAIAPVGDVEHKVKAAFHRNLKTLVMPIGNRTDLERSTLVPRAIVDEIVRCAADLDQVVKLAFGPAISP